MSKICVTKSLLNVSKDEFLHFRAEVNLAKLLKDKLSLKSFKAVAGSAFHDYSVKLVSHRGLELDNPLHIYLPEKIVSYVRWSSVYTFKGNMVNFFYSQSISLKINTSLLNDKIVSEFKPEITRMFWYYRKRIIA